MTPDGVFSDLEPLTLIKNNYQYLRQSSCPCHYGSNGKDSSQGVGISIQLLRHEIISLTLLIVTLQTGYLCSKVHTRIILSPILSPAT